MPKAKAKTGRNRRRLNAPSSRAEEQAAMWPVLSMRCRLMGWATTEENLRVVRAPIYETEAGRAIVRASPKDPEEQAELYEALTHIRRVVTRYQRSIAAPRPDPQNAAIMVMPEPFEAVDLDGARPEPLPPEEEAARARAAYVNLHRWVDELDDWPRTVLLAVAFSGGACRWDDRFAYALGLRHIHEHLTGKSRKRA